MKVDRKDFILLFSKVLYPTESVLINGELGFSRFLTEDQALEVLVRKRDLPSIISRFSQLQDGIQQVQLNSGYRSSQVSVIWQDTRVNIDFLHKLSHRSLLLLNEEEVLTRRNAQNNRIPVPCIEHLFEYQVLQAYLNYQGISDAVYTYFYDFHILIKEDLLEYFNQKYATQFEALYQLTDFRENDLQQMVRMLKTMPMNQLLNHIHLRWHNFLGNVRQAKLF